MSEITNPLFDNERDLLERQKEEYKNALMGDVDHIKSQGQEIGKKAAIAGGVLLAGYLLKRMFSGGKKKVKKLRAGKNKHTSSAASHQDAMGYNSFVHEQEDGYTISSERMHHADPPTSSRKTGVAKSFMKSEVGQAISQQVMALLMVYITKKVEEYLSNVARNNEMAANKPVEVVAVETTEIIVPREDAL